MTPSDSKGNDWDLNKWLARKKKEDRKQEFNSRDDHPVADDSDLLQPSPLDRQASSIEGAANNGSWSFWNRSTSSLDSTVDKVLPLTLKPNTLYTEELILRNEVAVDPLRSTSISNTQNIVIPSFEESVPRNTYYTHIGLTLSKWYNKLGYGIPGTGDKIFATRNSYPNTSFKKVLIIGVHGFFPTKYLRPLIGEPTGTSQKFMSEAENSFKIWMEKNKNYFPRNSRIQLSKIALELEGKVFDRVHYFLEVLSNLDIDQYDMIFVAAHSQGTPVSIILMSQLIENGYITNANKKIIGVLAMAGISNGPFYGIDQRMFVKAYSRFESDSMLELFKFQDFDSIHAKKYLHSLKILVSNNVRVMFVGSIDDQLVPLYSSICSHVSHPNITRYVYIDKDSNTPEFLVRILNCSLLLQNMGLSDHGMIKEISTALAGPLTGGGHSKIYNDFKVYELGIKSLLYTAPSASHAKLPMTFKPFNISKLGENPFYLPWCLRGLMYDSQQNLPNGQRDVVLMLRQFDEWNPTTKLLKDIKYRLNAMKAKL